MQAAHIGHDDGGKAIACWHVGCQLPQRACHFQSARQAGGTARYEQRRPQSPARRKACVPRSGWRQAAHLLRKACTRSEQKDPDTRHADQRQNETNTDAGARHEAGNLGDGFEGFRLWKVITRRVFPGTVDQVAQHHVSHINQHQTHQNFVGVKLVLQPCGDRCPKHTARNTRQNNGHHNPTACFFVGQHGHTASSHSTNDKLTFSTYVPDIGAITNGQTQSDDQQGRGLDHQFAQGIGRLERLPKKHLQAAHRIFA